MTHKDNGDKNGTTLRVYRPNTFLKTLDRLSEACKLQYSDVNEIASNVGGGSAPLVASQHKQPIAFVGEGGVGKTVLLREWIVQFQEENKEASVNLVTVGETIEARDYLSVVHALGQSLLLSVETAAKAIAERLVKDGLLPVSGGDGSGGLRNPNIVADELCEELSQYLNGTHVAMQTPSEYMRSWILRAAEKIVGLKIWIALDGVDFVLDKDLDGNNNAEARELVSAVPFHSCGLVVSVRRDYHMLDLWRLENWHLLTLRSWKEDERNQFLLQRWAETGCLVTNKEREEAAAVFETPQSLQVVLQEANRLGSECIEGIVARTQSSVTLLGYALELWEQDDRFAPGLLPCVLTAVLLSPRGASPADIALEYGFSVSSIHALEELAGTFLVFVDSRTIPCLPSSSKRQRSMHEKKSSVLHFPNYDFSRAVALRYLGTDVVVPAAQILYVATRDQGLFSKMLIGVLDLSEKKKINTNVTKKSKKKNKNKNKKSALPLVLAAAAVLNASAKQLDVMCHTLGCKLASVAVSQLAQASSHSTQGPTSVVVGILTEMAKKLTNSKKYVEKQKEQQDTPSDHTDSNVVARESMDAAMADEVVKKELVIKEKEVMKEKEVKKLVTEENEEEKEVEKSETRLHSPSLQEISALLHGLLSSTSMDQLLLEFTEGGKRQQAEDAAKVAALALERDAAEVNAVEVEAAGIEVLTPARSKKGYRQFQNLIPNEANAEFLAHVQDGKAASYVAPMYILRRDPFVTACLRVLPRGSVPREDLYTLFDALDWTADSDRDGYVSWEDLIDLILISAKGKDMNAGSLPETEKNKSNNKSAGVTGVAGVVAAAESAPLQDSLVWKLQTPDPVLSYANLASIPKEKRDLISTVLPVYHDFVTTTHNGDLVLISEPTSDQIKSAEMKGQPSPPRTETPLPLLEKDLKAVTVCWCPQSRVVCCSLMRRTAPSFVGLQFLEPLRNWELSPHSVHYDVHATPITSISCYYGALPSDLASSMTTESFEIIFVGCEDGSVRFAELSDMIHSVEDSVLFHPRECTSMVTVIKYVPELRKIVTCSMDGNVRLIDFAMAGDIVTGLKLEERGVSGTFTWHSRPVLSIQFCQESQCFLSAGLDPTIYLWQPSNFKIIKVINTGHPSKGAHLLEGTSQVITIDAEVEYRNEKLHQCARIFNLFSGLEQQSIELIGVRPQAKPVQGSPIVVGSVPGACSCFAFGSRRGQLFIGSHKLRTLERAKIWVPSSIATHEHSIVAVLFSDNHFQLTTVDQRGIARVWNVRESTLLFDFTVLPQPNLLAAKKQSTVTAGCIGYAQERLFIGKSDGELSAWRMYNGGKLQEYQASEVEPVVEVNHVHGINCLVALSIRGTLSFWRDIVQLEPLRPIRIIEGMTTGTLSFMSIHGDKTCSEALVGDTHGRVVLWNALSSYAKADRFNWAPDGGPAANNPDLPVAVVCGHLYCSPPVMKSFLLTGSSDGYLRLYYLSLVRSLSLVTSVFSGGFSPARDGHVVLGPTAMDVSADGKEVVVGDAAGGVRIWSVTRVNKAKHELDLFPVEINLVQHWTILRPSKDESNVEVLPDLVDIGVSSVVAVKGWHTFVVGNQFSVKLYSRKGIMIGSFGQKQSWRHDEWVVDALPASALPLLPSLPGRGGGSNLLTSEIIKWTLLRETSNGMPPDWQKAAERKVVASPLARKLEMRKQHDDAEKEERLHNERVQHSIQSFNALALGEVKAVTLDGRECANLEETQGQVVFDHLAMRSGTLNGKRFKERMEKRRPLPPGTPAAIFSSRYDGKADFLPATPALGLSFTSLSNGLHLKEPSV